MSRSRIFAVIAVLAVVASACVQDDPAEPGVRAITTDLKYKELQKKNVAPPNTVPQEVPKAPQTLPPLQKGDVGPIEPDPASCPTPAPSVTAKENTTNAVSKLPTAGEYLWRVEGTQRYPGEDFRLGLPRFVKRTIENVDGTVNEEQQDFTFETLERDIGFATGGATTRSFFDVTSQTATDNTVRPGAGGISSGRTSTAGVRLVRLERQFGAEERIFIPSQPVRYLITPVLTGPERFWQDQVTDISGSDGGSLLHHAYVDGRITVEACGERFRAWKVVAEQTYSRGGESITRYYEYGVATQMGGILIFEHVESPCTKDDKGKCEESEPADLVFDASYGRRLEESES